MKKKRNYKANDSTFINVDADKKRDAKLAARVEELERSMIGIGQLLWKFKLAIEKHCEVIK